MRTLRETHKDLIYMGSRKQKSRKRQDLLSKLEANWGRVEVGREEAGRGAEKTVELNKYLKKKRCSAAWKQE